MPIIDSKNLKVKKLSGPQLKYLESLVEQLHEPTFKVNRLTKIVGRKIAFLSDLTLREASLVIDTLKKELGYE